MTATRTTPDPTAATRDTAQDALNAVLAAAALRNPVITGNDGRQHALIPPGFKTEDITDRHRLPPRPAARVVVDDRVSLVAYTNRHQDKATSILFGDYDGGSITARLDWHPHNDNGAFGDAGANSHSCSLILRPSEEWTRWNAMAGKLHAQADFALFLEENATDISDPAPTTFIELARDLEAASGRTFKSRTRLDNGDMEFAFAEESRITNRATVPDSFTLIIPLYQGEAPEAVEARFRWKALPDGLRLGFVWHRAEYMRQARFAQIVAAAAEETGLPFILGRA